MKESLAFLGKLCFLIGMIDLALQRAKDIAGGNAGLAKAIGGVVTPQAVSQWKRVPVARVLEIERATGIPRHELRPDFYPLDDPRPSEHSSEAAE